MAEGPPVLIGVDPGMANFGWAVVALGPGTMRVLSLDIVRTEKSQKKRNVLASDDNVRRLREVSKTVWALASNHNVSGFCLESMSFPRSASAAAKMAMTWGVVCAVAEALQIPIFQASPQQIKLKLCGQKDASKDDVEAAVKKAFPEASKLLKAPRSVQNHAWDAVAAAMTCADSEVVRMVRKLAKSEVK